MTSNGYEQDNEGGWNFLSDEEGEDESFSMNENKMSIMEEHSLAMQEEYYSDIIE